jgi:DNA-3-methyladenine glycosylase
MKPLPYEFYHRPCLEVAPDLVGKVLVHNGQRLRISETEAYCGENDTACHAHKGRTKRTEVLYADAGTVYIYLCYGMHWMLNIITGALNRSSAVNAPTLWIEDDGFRCQILTDKRVGIGYAAPEDRDRLWRFKMGPQKNP